MAAIGDPPVEAPKPGGRGWFAWRLKEVSDIVDGQEETIALLYDTCAELAQENETLRALCDPEEIEFIHQNFTEIVDILNALRRINRFPALSELGGTRGRRQKAERAKETR